MIGAVTIPPWNVQEGQKQVLDGCNIQERKSYLGNEHKTCMTQHEPTKSHGVRAGMLLLFIALGPGLFAQMVLGVQAGWNQLHSSGAEYRDPYWRMSYSAGDAEGGGGFANAFIRSSDSTRFAFQFEAGYAKRTCVGTYEEIWNDYGQHSQFLGTSAYQLGSVDLGILLSLRASRWMRLVGGLQLQVLASTTYTERGQKWVSSSGVETVDPNYEKTVSGTKDYDNGVAYVAGVAFSPIRRFWVEARYLGMLQPIIVWKNADPPVSSSSLQAGLAYDLFSK